MAKDNKTNPAAPATDAPAPAATASTAAMTAEERKAAAKERKRNRPAFPRPEGGLTEVSADYSPTKFQKLGPKDFAAEHFYLSFMADQHEKKAKRFRAAASESQLVGDSKHAAKAKKMLKMQRELAEIKAQLEADGLNPADILAKLSA
jgi:hypothetical protein